MAMTPQQKAKYQKEWKKPENRKSGEIITPGSVVRGVAKVAAKVAGKQTAKKLTTAEKAMVKDVKSVAKNAKPGSVQKMMDKLPLEQKRAYSQALRKAVPDKKKAAIYKTVKQAKPSKVVKRTTDPINKNAQTDAILEQQYAKSVKIAKAMGSNPKKVRLTMNGRTIDFNGIK